jgi:heavy metal translocating P-type ATPase
VKLSQLSWLETWQQIVKYRFSAIAVLSVIGIAAHLYLRFATNTIVDAAIAPLKVVLLVGGIPLLVELTLNVARREFGSDLLAGLSIITSVLLNEYLAGALVVLMLSGGQALEAHAVRSASRVLEALAKRMPATAHRRQNGRLQDVDLAEIRINDELVVFPHEVCPVDGIVTKGHSSMDESYLTGEPYVLSKTPGSEVLSGAINGEFALTVRATRLPVDSRYSKIVRVMRASEQQRPPMRRLADVLGAYYTPLAVAIAAVAWVVSGDPVRFLAVLVVATPCPLLIAIPVAIIGAISLAARRGIIVKDPAALEEISKCRTAIFDKTGTLTYGRPKLVDVAVCNTVRPDEILALTASLERYSKHPLSGAILEAAKSRNLALYEAEAISEPPGAGLKGLVQGRDVFVTGRKAFSRAKPEQAEKLPPQAGGLECIVVIDGDYVATMRFRDEPRHEGKSFIEHLHPKHDFRRIMLVSGDRKSEVEHLAKRVGIQESYASQSPEQKLAIVRHETARDKTVFLGDGINDAPALTAATVGIAIGQNSDVTAEAADAVILDSSLESIDVFLHIGRRMRRIALQSAIGGMALSIVGMFLAATGYLPPVAGAISQEAIDVIVVSNALRMAITPARLTDF